MRSMIVLAALATGCIQNEVTGHWLTSIDGAHGACAFGEQIETYVADEETRYFDCRDAEFRTFVLAGNEDFVLELTLLGPDYDERAHAAYNLTGVDHDVDLGTIYFTRM